MMITNVCGIDCNPGDAECNGYCTGKEEAPRQRALEDSEIRAMILGRIYPVLDFAASLGKVVSINQRAREPLAMGNYTTHIDITDSHSVYRGGNNRG